jgi:hypothetical protein
MNAADTLWRQQDLAPPHLPGIRRHAQQLDKDIGLGCPGMGRWVVLLCGRPVSTVHPPCRLQTAMCIAAKTYSSMRTPGTPTAAEKAPHCSCGCWWWLARGIAWLPEQLQPWPAACTRLLHNRQVAGSSLSKYWQEVHIQHVCCCIHYCGGPCSSISCLPHAPSSAFPRQHMHKAAQGGLVMLISHLLGTHRCWLPAAAAGAQPWSGRSV